MTKRLSGERVEELKDALAESGVTPSTSRLLHALVMYLAHTYQLTWEEAARRVKGTSPNYAKQLCVQWRKDGVLDDLHVALPWWPDMSKGVRPEPRGIQASIYVSDKDLELARELGDGNASKGFRKALELARIELGQ